MKRPKDMTQGELEALPVAPRHAWFRAIPDGVQEDDIVYFDHSDKTRHLLFPWRDGWVRIPERQMQVKRTPRNR